MGCLIFHKVDRLCSPEAAAKLKQRSCALLDVEMPSSRRESS